MARYTTEYGQLIKTGYEPLLICLSNYPLYDESHRAELNEKILNRFKYREIGAETAARFVHYLNAQLFEIMPYYNRLFKVELDKIDPLIDADYTEDTDASTKGSTVTKGTNGSKNVHMYSDTPQGGFAAALIDAAQSFETNANMTGDMTTSLNSEKVKSSPATDTKAGYTMPQMAATSQGHDAYMSEASTDLTTGANAGSALSETGAKAGRKVKGKFPGVTYGTMLDDFKRAVWNIDKMILDDLEVCFMGVY